MTGRVALHRTRAWVAVFVGFATTVLLSHERLYSAQTSTRTAPRLSATRFLAFGDSLTAGILETPLPAGQPPVDYPSKLREMLAARYRDQRFTVVNAGWGGEKTTDGLVRLPGILKKNRPEVVLLMEGTNDLVDDEPGVKNAMHALDQIVGLAKTSGARALVATIPPQRAGSRRASAAAMVPVFNLHLAALAREKKWHLVDVNKAYDDLAVLLGPDGLHPSPAGYQRIAEAFFKAIETLLEVRAAP